MLTLKDIERMTQDDDEGWCCAHVQRLLRLTATIGEQVPHDSEALLWAVYLHDWGALPKYAQSGVLHALRSRQIAEAEILPHTHFSAAQKRIILEAIEKHDYKDERPVESSEALLLREADWLDMLGAIGIARDFAWGPNQLQVCYDRILKHRDSVQHRFTLPAAQQIAAQRIEHMNLILDQIREESFSWL